VAYISPGFSDAIRSGILVKGEEGVASVYFVKWQCSFKDTLTRTLGQEIVGSTSSPPGAALQSNSGLLGSWMASMQ